MLIARRSIRARLGRTIAIAVAIMAGVSFVVGSFVLADSLRATFSDLFDELTQELDLEVRSAQEFDTDASRDPIPAELAEQVEAVAGVEIVEPTVSRYAQLVDESGDAITTVGGPTIGVSWLGDEGLQGVTVKDGRAPQGPDELAIDQATASREDIEVGDTVEYLTDTGSFEGTVVGTLGLADSDGFAGAAVVALDLDTAIDHFGTNGMVDAIDIGLAEGADTAAVQAELEAALPSGVEVITGEELSEETSDEINEFVDVFGTGLLVFAFVTAFVSAFIINNVFQITIGQRLRELALLRAVGASERNVQRMIVGEALVLAVVATALGVGGGIIVARLLVAAFGAAGAGFPDAATVLLPRTVVIAAIVGVGITLASVIVPARRAARIPPVAAMRPEVGFSALRASRLVLGVGLTVLGGVLFVVGLLVRPGGTLTLAVLAGGGALLLFLGVASVSSTIASPVTRVIGWPIERLFDVPGALARENVARVPRRTSSSAAALMIGVSLVSAAAVFASSLRATFVETLEEAINADYVVTSPNFDGLSPIVAENLAEVPVLDAVTPVRGTGALIEGDVKSLGAVDADAFAALVDPDVVDGSIEGLEIDEVLVQEDPADDLGLAVGSTVDVTYQNGTTGTLTVAGIYTDATFGNWLIGLDTLEAVSNAPARDFFVIAGLADGVDAEEGDDAVRAAMAEFPQADVQTNAEFRQQQEDQINQLLLVITMLLAFSILIAMMGISITLALGVLERTREIGLLRAVGMTRRQVRRSVRWEAVIVSIFGAVVGIILGTFLGVVISLAVPEEFVSELRFSPGIVIAILVAAVFAGLIAALYPARKAARMDVLRAIATE